MRPRSLVPGLLATLLLVGGVAGCGSSEEEESSTPAAPTELYVSLGDSYAAGYQPTSEDEGATNRNGFAYQLVEKLKDDGRKVKLVNFGCAGATTASIINAPGCEPERLGPGAEPYDEPQGAAAEAYLDQHRDDLAFVTISIGGNDVTSCATQPDPIPCIAAAITTIKQNLTTLVQRVRAAAGPDVPIIGITYPDVVLGGWVSPDPKAKDLARLSVTAFQSLINPALKEVYESVDATFVDVTAETGAYGSFDETTDAPGYGVVPKPVAEVCRLTYYCELTDIHPRTEGYERIAELVADALPAR
jgi:lysophospholipase L1-like esterase